MASTSRRSEHLDDAMLKRLKAQLERERTKLRARLDEQNGRVGGGVIEDPLLREPEDFGDLASDITNEDTEQAIAANDAGLLEQVELALRRVDDGTYGLSEVTGKPIPYERLAALPWATTNVGD